MGLAAGVDELPLPPPVFTGTVRVVLGSTTTNPFGPILYVVPLNVTAGSPLFSVVPGPSTKPFGPTVNTLFPTVIRLVEGTGTVRVVLGSMITSPDGPILSVVPEIVRAGSPDWRVVPGPKTTTPFDIVNVEPPTVTTLLLPALLGMGTVDVPEGSTITRPLGPILMVVPETVSAGSP